LIVDSILNGTAQSTANIMAANSSCAHIGGVDSRVAAAGFGGGAQVFATENIACGGSLTLNKMIYEYWADADHMIPMVNSYYTHVGAAVGENNGYYYYVLHAAYTSGSQGSFLLPTSAYAGSANTAAPAAPVRVSTSIPKDDGIIVHKVQQGQAAWSIALAYNVTVADLVRLNNLYPAENPLIYVGQDLLIREAFTPTVSPTVTNTLRAPSRTPWPTITPRPVKPAGTDTPTATPTTPPLFPEIPSLNSINRQSIGFGILAICLIGLVVMLVTSMRADRKK